MQSATTKCPWNVIDNIVATCNGDLRGAIKALSLVNERMESELQHFQEKTAHQADLDADCLVGYLGRNRSALCPHQVTGAEKS
jgi:hypothetical protein